MLLLAWSTFRDRWQVFAGAIITVCLGVALVQSSLLILIAAATAPIPPGTSPEAARALRMAYDGALSLLGMQLGLVVFVAVFIVSTTFAFTVSQRRQELALLRLTGADRGQIRSLLLGEAILLGLVGSALGILLGLPTTHLQGWMLEQFEFIPPGFEVPWRWWMVFASLGTGVLIALLGVLAASRQASRVQPLEALRDSGSAVRVMTASRWVLGVLFLGGSAVLFLLFPASDTPRPYWFIQLTPFLISLPLVIGFSALAPLMVPLVGRLSGVLLRGQLGTLIVANLRSDSRRSASTAAPVMLLFAVVVSVAGTLSSVSAASQEQTLMTVEGDYLVTAQEPLAAELTALDGVEVASQETTVEFEIDVSDGYSGSWVEVHDGVIADPAAYEQTRDVEATDGSLADLDGAAIAVSPERWERNWSVGDTLTIRVDGQEHQAPVVALLPERLSGPYFLLSPDLLPAGAGPWEHIVQLSPGADASAVRAELEPYGTVESVDQWVSEAGAADDLLTLKIMVQLLGMTMLFTVIAMVNAVVISASNRRREFATARISGLTRSQVMRMALWESQAVVAIGLFLGGLSAAASIIGVALSLRTVSGLFVISMPWPLVIALALGCAVVVGTTSVLTTVAGTRTPPIRLVASRE